MQPTAQAVGTVRKWNQVPEGRKKISVLRNDVPEDSHAHATDEQLWKTPKVVVPIPKEIVTMRLDADLLRWFRRERGYQTRINAILRAYMQAHDGI
jgi:uncharacterized protein (DUF4415 family)